ncbi:hypothetical protein [Isoptericola sp. NPDC057191]|uniref:hypothetical protein n=1 Tax=Isoptericola sp. NPDC057191 TaxID=3346041 RepID=UPI00363B93F0
MSIDQLPVADEAVQGLRASLASYVTRMRETHDHEGHAYHQGVMRGVQAFELVLSGAGTPGALYGRLLDATAGLTQLARLADEATATGVQAVAAAGFLALRGYSPGGCSDPEAAAAFRSIAAGTDDPRAACPGIQGVT